MTNGTLADRSRKGFERYLGNCTVGGLDDTAGYIKALYKSGSINKADFLWLRAKLFSTDLAVLLRESNIRGRRRFLWECKDSPIR